MEIKILGKISYPKTIAIGKSTREIDRLNKVYGPGRWRKCKGIANVRLPDGTICIAEIHWYKAHGIGQKEFKIKRIINY